MLRSYINTMKDQYDYVLIDYMPSRGMTTINALAAADSIIIPVQAHYLPAKGMTQLLQTIANSQGKATNQSQADLTIDGVLVTWITASTLPKTFPLSCSATKATSCAFSKRKFPCLSVQQKPALKERAFTGMCTGLLRPVRTSIMHDAYSSMIFLNNRYVNKALQKVKHYLHLERFMIHSKLERIRRRKLQ